MAAEEEQGPGGPGGLVSRGNWELCSRGSGWGAGAGALGEVVGKTQQATKVEMRAWGAPASAAGQGCCGEEMGVIPARRVIPVPPGGGGADTGSGPRIRHWLEWCMEAHDPGNYLGEAPEAQRRREKRVSRCGAAGRRGVGKVRAACGAAINRRPPEKPCPRPLAL